MADELWVAGRAHFGDVEAGDFDFGGDAVAAEEAADEVEDDAADDQVPTDADDGGDDLDKQLLGGVAAKEDSGDIAGDIVETIAEGSVGEESDGDDSPEAGDAVDADGADGVIDAFAFEVEDAPDDDQPGDGAGD